MGDKKGRICEFGGDIVLNMTVELYEYSKIALKVVQWP